MNSLPAAGDGIAATVSYLMSEQKRLAKAGWGYIAGYLIVATAPYVYLDLFAYTEDGLYALAGLLLWGLGYVLFVGLMSVGGHLGGGMRTGIGTYFVLGIAVGVPVFIGLFALVVPGLYLLARWLPAYSRALVSDEGIGAAMRWSWDKTAPFAWPLALSVLLPLVGYAASLGMMFGYEASPDSFSDTSYTTAVIVWNGVLSVGMAWLTVAGIAGYGMLVRQEEGFGDVFR